MRVPNNKIPKFGVVSSDFLPEKIDLVDAISVVDTVDSAIQSVTTRIEKPSVMVNPGTLTEAEAEEIDKRMDSMIQEIRSTRELIGAIKKQVSEDVQKATANSGGELGYEIDISRNPVLKEAARKLFGRKVRTLTYSMYLELINAKKQMELEDIRGYN